MAAGLTKSVEEAFQFLEVFNTRQLGTDRFAAGNVFDVGEQFGSHSSHRRGFVAVVPARDGHVRVAKDELKPLLDRRFFGDFSCAKVFFRLAKDPGGGHSCPPYHESGDGGVFSACFDIFRGGDVSVADDRDVQRLGAGVNNAPIRFPSVLLGAGSSVDGEGLYACVLKPLPGFQGADVFSIPTDAYFGGDRTIISQNVDYGAGDILKQRQVFQ